MKNNIKIERAKHNITQDELSKRVNVSRQTINAMEKGKYAPSTVLALKLAEVFKTEVSALFELEKDDWK